MNKGLAIAGGAALATAVALAVFSGGSEAHAAGAEPGSPITVPAATGSQARGWIEQLTELGDVQAWRPFWLGLAAGETAGTFASNVALGNPKLLPEAAKPSPSTAALGPAEAANARRAYEAARAQGYFADCPWPEAAYTFGSCGWWSQVPGYAYIAYHRTPIACRHPYYLLHPVDQLVCAEAFARRMMRRSSFQAQPNWLSLRVGWGSPANIGDPERRAAVAERWGEVLDELGIGADWMLEPVAPLASDDVYARWQHLMSNFTPN